MSITVKILLIALLFLGAGANLIALACIVMKEAGNCGKE